MVQSICGKAKMKNAPTAATVRVCGNWKTFVIPKHIISIAKVSSSDNEIFKKGGYHGRNKNRIADD